MAQQDTPLKPSVLLLVRNMALAAGCAVAGYYLVQTAETVVVVIGGIMLVAGPLMFIALPFMGMPGRGPCPECGGTIETIGSSQQNLLCRGCNSYLDAGGGKLQRSDPNRVTAEPTFAAPTPWKDVTLVVYPTISFSVQDAIQDWMTTKKGGVRIMEARWPQACCVCGATSTRFDTASRVFAKPGNIVDTQLIGVAKDVPYCRDHKDGLIFERVISATPGASGCFGIKFRSLAYRNAFMRANPWPFTWHQ